LEAATFIVGPLVCVAALAAIARRSLGEVGFSAGDYVNIEQSTFNSERRTAGGYRLFVQCWMFWVDCSIFALSVPDRWSLLLKVSV
jgi:hypothetical protein